MFLACTYVNGDIIEILSKLNGPNPIKQFSKMVTSNFTVKGGHKSYLCSKSILLLC